MAIERAFRGVSVPKFFPAQGRSILIFLVVTLTWIPFRSVSADQAVTIMQGLANTSKIDSLDIPGLVAFAAILFTIRWQFNMKDSGIEEIFRKRGQLAQIGIIALTLISLFLCSGGNSNAFIYFQF